MTYYKTIDGIRYDASLLTAADDYTKGRGESQLSLDEIKIIFSIASDARKITETEWRTLRYINRTYRLTAPAKAWLAERLDNTNELAAIEKTMERIVRREFGLKGVSWIVPPDLLREQQQYSQNNVDFEQALRGALKAFLRRGLNQLSLAVTTLRFLNDQELTDQKKKERLIRTFMERGSTLFLVPERIEDRQKLQFDLPSDLNTQIFWHIGLRVLNLSPVLFMSYVLRENPSDPFNRGYISSNVEINSLMHTVVRQLTNFKTLRYEINPATVERQMALAPDQNFGEALFTALDVGIFNGESSISFRDFIQQEIWSDPDMDIMDYQREYAETGVLYLLDPEQPHPDFPIPENLIPDFSFNWVFGLAMPQKTDVRFIITSWRQRNGLEASWNDGFIPETLSIPDQIRRVLATEFDLPQVQVVASEAVFEAQRIQQGPNFRGFASLLRQALNTILHDYLTENSPFNYVLETYPEKMDIDQFETPYEFRIMIKRLIRTYLDNATLELLAPDQTEKAPSKGESIEQFWQFYGHMPKLSPKPFWVLIPRYPDDEQRPYAYGFVTT
jgi:hypothetical protein